MNKLLALALMIYAPAAFAFGSNIPDQFIYGCSVTQTYAKAGTEENRGPMLERKGEYFKGELLKLEAKDTQVAYEVLVKEGQISLTFNYQSMGFALNRSIRKPLNLDKAETLEISFGDIARDGELKKLTLSCSKL